MGYGNKLDLVRQFSSLNPPDPRIHPEIDIDKLSSSLTTDFLPRNDVGMVFHDRNQDLVSLSQNFLSKACHPVKAGCRSSGEENFFVDPALINLRMVSRAAS